MGCCVTKPQLFADADLAPVASTGCFGKYTCHVLRAEHEAEAVGVLARSFNGKPGEVAGEPCNEWVLTRDADGLPGEAGLEYFRASVQPWVQRVFFLSALRKGGLVVGTRDGAGALVGVAVVFLPATHKRSDADELCTLCALGCAHGGVLSGLPDMDVKRFGKWPALRTKAYEAAPRAAAVAALRAPFGGRHWKLEVLATEPTAQGQGVSRATTSAVFALADRARAPLLVECAGEPHRAMYKRLGFVDGEASHELAVTGDAAPPCSLWYLLRNSSGSAPPVTSAAVAPMPMAKAPVEGAS